MTTSPPAVDPSDVGGRPSRLGQATNEAESRVVARGLVQIVRAYQITRSGRPTGCRYVPSCSEYAAQALEEFGVVRGGWLSLKRIARCNPWGGHGVDPVPDRRVSCSHR